MKNIILCVDHNIGYDIANYVTNNKSNVFHILEIFTSETNCSGFWRKIKDVPNLSAHCIFNHKTFIKDIEHFDDIDYIFLLSWKYLILPEVIKKVKLGIVNLHYSLLPKYRGVYPVNNAIINSEEETGITYHCVDANIDKGEIISQKKINIELCDTADTLLHKLDILALEEFKLIWKGERELSKSFSDNTDEKLKYFSRKHFDTTNKLDLNKHYTGLKLINLLRGKTFYDKSSLYFKDRSGQKIYVSIRLNKEDKCKK